MERLFEQWPFEWVTPWSRRALAVREWGPRVDIFDRPDKVVIKAELPGMNKEDIDISVSGNVLTIQGERKAEEEVKDEDYYCCEQHGGPSTGPFNCRAAWRQTTSMPLTITASWR